LRGLVFPFGNEANLLKSAATMQGRSALLKVYLVEGGGTSEAGTPFAAADRVKFVGEAVSGSVLVEGVKVRFPAKRVSNGMRATQKNWPFTLAMVEDTVALEPPPSTNQFTPPDVSMSGPAVFVTLPYRVSAGSGMPLAFNEVPATANANSATTNSTNLLEDDFICGFLFSLIGQQAQGLTPVSIMIRIPVTIPAGRFVVQSF
jgi:hypothetical protein